jgi:uncharacterized damage-inducible protein DinB
MKELLLQYARYNVWANKRIIDVLLKQDEELLDKAIESSFPSIKATVYHMWGAEFIWLQRLQLTEHPVYMPDVFKGTLSEACVDWQKVSQTFISFIERKYDDRALEHVTEYISLGDRLFKNADYLSLHHVFNHATYHRGQLITMMRQSNITPIPNTDFTTFFRKP